MQHGLLPRVHTATRTYWTLAIARNLQRTQNLRNDIPEHHALRGIDRCLDLSALRAHLAEHYSHTGRPADMVDLVIPAV